MVETFNGLTTVNVELTSRCNKSCWMCGRRKIDKDYPEIALKYGDMDFELVKKIAAQLPDDIVAQLHNNGEPLLYPYFGKAAKLFKKQIRCINTNAKLIVEKAPEIIDNIDTMAISIIQDDSESEEQYRLVKEFLEIRGDRRPNLVYRCLGGVDTQRWKELEGIVTTRTLHKALGSFDYKREPTKPEIGICLDILNHMAINKDGDVSICVRFDPLRLGVLGNVNDSSLLDIWNGEKRGKWVQAHIDGKRDEIPLCSYCDFWGVPTSY